MQKRCDSVSITLKTGKRKSRRPGGRTLWCVPAVGGAHLDHVPVFVISCVCSRLPNYTGAAPNAGRASGLFLKSFLGTSLIPNVLSSKNHSLGVCM